MRSLTPPPSPPPAPPTRRASWVGYVRHSELSPGDKEVHDFFTAGIIRAENEAAEARMAEQAARAELTKFRLAHGMRGNTGAYRTPELTVTRWTDRVAPADRPTHPHFMEAIQYDANGFILGTHWILKKTRRKTVPRDDRPWKLVGHPPVAKQPKLTIAECLANYQAAYALATAESSSDESEFEKKVAAAAAGPSDEPAPAYDGDLNDDGDTDGDPYLAY